MPVQSGGGIGAEAFGPIDPIQEIVTTPSERGGGGGKASSGVDFGKELLGAIQRAGSAERAADDAAQRFAAGDPKVGIHEVMITTEKAAISVRYAVTLKSKILEAYKELMATQI